MNRLHLAVPLIAALLTSAAAQAQEVDVSEPTITRDQGQGWSWLSGKTVGQGSTVVGGELGWPGLSGTVLHGVAPNLDLGGRLTFNYGFQGIVTTLLPGFKVNGVLRWMLLEDTRFNLGLEFAPGPFFYFPGGRTPVTEVGMDLPVGLNFGVPVGSAVMLNFGLDLPMFAVFGNGGGFYLPILMGAGAEYFIEQNLLVSFSARMGPTLRPYWGAVFTLDATIGVAYRM